VAHPPVSLLERFLICIVLGLDTRLATLVVTAGRGNVKREDPRRGGFLAFGWAALEQARLVTTEKVGRVRTCKLGSRPLEEETAWLERYRQLWASCFDELNLVVEDVKRKERIDGRKKKTVSSPR